ncbi:hypothetical protein TWF730_011364 [Orbilia blumenaviensis]|uniref:Secreted protein n=1 Tax=Orbilia blumenaviensis TaxID=1796055 RepID=A0AAV9ULS7_9PEZI
MRVYWLKAWGGSPSCILDVPCSSCLRYFFLSLFLLASYPCGFGPSSLLAIERDPEESDFGWYSPVTKLIQVVGHFPFFEEAVVPPFNCFFRRGLPFGKTVVRFVDGCVLALHT